MEIVNRFEGLHYGCNYRDYCRTSSPPDVQLAVGPNHVFEMVNRLGAIWTKNGSLVNIYTLNHFFAVNESDHLFDPRVVYDNLSGTWFATVGDKDDGTVYLAVSRTDDPTGLWWVNKFSVRPETWADQPIVGVSNDKVVISTNDYFLSDDSYAGAEYWIMRKSDLTSGSHYFYDYYRTDKREFAIHPVRSLTPTDTEFLVSVLKPDKIRVYSVTGLPKDNAGNPSNVSRTFTDLTVGTMKELVNATQPDSGYLVDASDGRIQDALWSNGRLWLTFIDGCTFRTENDTRLCVRLIQIDTNENKVLQDFYLGAAGYYYFYSALSLDSAGDLVVVFSYTSSDSYPSIAFTAQPVGSEPNKMLRPYTLRQGTWPVTNATGYCTNGICRYGDYLGASTDPETGSVWVAGEYATRSGWATHIGEIRVNAAVPEFPDFIVPLLATLVPVLLVYRMRGRIFRQGIT